MHLCLLFLADVAMSVLDSCSSNSSGVLGFGILRFCSRGHVLGIVQQGGLVPAVLIAALSFVVQADSCIGASISFSLIKFLSL